MFVITGGSRGIGQALALRLAAQEHQVLIIGRDQKTLHNTQNKSNQIKICVADVATETGRESIIKALSGFSNIKGLIHNAGTIEPIAPMQQLSADAWRNVLETNLNAPFFLTQTLYPKLKHGRVLHIGSGAAYFPVQGWAPYCVSKAGLAMLTQAWQLECPDMATASVMPGIVQTEMQAHIRASAHQDPSKKKFFKDLYDQKQLIHPKTVAAFLSWLLLDIDTARYKSQEWDIYNTSHHSEWLKPPFEVPALPPKD